MGLRPFFSYFGSKWMVSRLYPKPEYGTIVEPFAGSAGYSLRYPDLKVILCDLDPIIVGVWDYLIHAKTSEILALPYMGAGDHIDDLCVPQEAKWLIGFWLNSASASPKLTPSKWMQAHPEKLSYWSPRRRHLIASQVESIRHWQVCNCSYSNVPFGDKATWFIDPPYEVAGRFYRFGSKKIDYEALGTWCRSRPGQTIVCENDGATWLPFRHLADIRTARGSLSKEVIWTRLSEKSGFDLAMELSSMEYDDD